MTSMAAHLSQSTPVMLPIIGEWNEKHMQLVGECQHGTGYVGTQGLNPPQVNVNGRFSQPASCNSSSILNAYAHLMQGENESIAQYLTRAKVLLECIHHNSKMCDIQVLAMTNFTLSEDCGHHMPDEG